MRFGQTLCFNWFKLPHTAVQNLLNRRNNKIVKIISLVKRRYIQISFFIILFYRKCGVFNSTWQLSYLITINKIYPSSWKWEMAWDHHVSFVLYYGLTRPRSLYTEPRELLEGCQVVSPNSLILYRQSKYCEMVSCDLENHMYLGARLSSTGTYPSE